MTTSDRVESTGTDPAHFRPSLGRLYVVVLGLAGLAWGVVRTAVLLLAAVLGQPPSVADLQSLALSTAGYAVVAAAVVVAVVASRPPCVEASPAGIRFAGTGRRPVFLPWSVVDSVTLRPAGVFTELIITRTDPPHDGSAHDGSAHDGSAHDGSAHDGSAQRGSDGGPRTFVVDLGLLCARPATVAAGVRRAVAAR